MTSTADTKYCPCCKQDKLFFRFSKNVTKHKGLSSYCKDCDATKAKKYKSSERGKETINKYERSARKYMSRVFSETGIRISEDDAASRLLQTNCDLCGSKFKNKRDSHFDHDHITLCPRGQICRRCNCFRIASLEQNDIHIYLDYLNKFESHAFHVILKYFKEWSNKWQPEESSYTVIPTLTTEPSLVSTKVTRSSRVVTQDSMKQLNLFEVH